MKIAAYTYKGKNKKKHIAAYTEKNWKKKCGERGSNTRPSDLQSDALPTELSPPSSSFYKESFMLANMGHQIVATNEMIRSRTVIKHSCTFHYELEIANNRLNHTVLHGL